MHSNNFIRVTFMFGVFSSNTPFYAEDFVSYSIFVRDTFSILSCVVAHNLLVFVFGDLLPINDLLHVEQHVPTEYYL